MSLVRTLKHKDPTPAVVMSIDASSTVVAFAIFDQSKDKTVLLETSKLILQKIPLNQKLQMLSAYIPTLFEKYKITHVFVEQPIYIQNPLTSRLLAHISGHVLGVCLEHCDNVEEVQIANWKSFIGYKNVSKKEKDAWTAEFGEKESKKMAISERKQRTIRIIHEKIEGTDHIDDNDICDAIGIGLFGLNKVNNG